MEVTYEKIAVERPSTTDSSSTIDDRTTQRIDRQITDPFDKRGRDLIGTITGTEIGKKQKLTQITDNTYHTKPKNRRRLKGKTKKQKRTNNVKTNKFNKILKDNIVINYSAYKLTKAELSLLNKGLGFVPTVRGPNIYKHNVQLQRFERKLQNFLYFQKQNSNKDNSSTYHKVPFTGNSDWQPKHCNNYISKFVRELNIKLLDTRKDNILQNITKAENIALKNLKSNKDIIIKKADKGGNIVIMDRCSYIDKISIMLNDINTYQEITSDLTLDIHRAAVALIRDRALYKGTINNKQTTYLTVFKPRCPVFYGLPKIHKPQWPLRPIVSQINGPLSRLNELVDTYLKPCIEFIPELLKDTTNFLQIITTLQDIPNLYKNALLVTIDVTALYTNIPHEEGARWVAEFYAETYPKWKHKHPHLKAMSSNTLLELMLFILQNNVFTFNRKYFKQLIGTTMGAQFSVNYANIYMHKLFRYINDKYNLTLPLGFARFVDDIFLMWIHEKAKLESYLKLLNSCHNTIKFTFEMSNDSINFLDTTVYIQNNKLFTKLYKKPTDNKKYLAFNSAHPSHVKKAIPYSQGLRIKRIVNDENILDTELKLLSTKFLDRGYPKLLIDKELSKINKIPREKLLTYKSNNNEVPIDSHVVGNIEKPFIPLILTYFSQYETSKKAKVHQIFNTLWTNFLDSNMEIKNIFGKAKPTIVYSKGSSLSNYLVRAALPESDLNDSDWELVQFLNRLTNEPDVQTA